LPYYSLKLLSHPAFLFLDLLKQVFGGTFESREKFIFCIFVKKNALELEAVRKKFYNAHGPLSMRPCEF
jgi:hypothetical protein